MVKLLNIGRIIRKHQLQKSLLYHILNRGNGKNDVFHDEDDFVYFRELLKEYKEEHNFLVYHWVLMNNHFHLVMELAKPEELSGIMAGVLRSYVHYHHRKYKSSGHLWQGRFKSQAIEKELYLLACGRYVERNPVRAKIVKYAWEWSYSSARFYAFGKEDGLTALNPVYEQWDEGKEILRQQRYQEWITIPDEEEEVELFKNADKTVGSEGFLGRLVCVSDRHMPRRKGRPRKE